MSWRKKSARFKLLSLLPGGSKFYRYSQEKLTHSVQATRPRVDGKLNAGLIYWDWLTKHGREQRLLRGETVDLGAGWHPSIPLLWYGLGADRQLLVDIFPNMDGQKAADTARLVCEIARDPQWKDKPVLKRFPEVKNTPVPADPNAVLKPFGIEYLAPYGNKLAVERGRYDMVICTQVLQHVEKPVQLAIFKELFASLKPGGLFLATVHLVGHFGNPVQRAGQYEHLKPSPWVWENLINSSLMSFNRLKAPDYRESLEAAGFRLIEFDVTRPNAEDLMEFKRVQPHACFSHYTPEELASRHVFFVAEKP